MKPLSSPILKNGILMYTHILKYQKYKIFLVLGLVKPHWFINKEEQKYFIERERNRICGLVSKIVRLKKKHQSLRSSYVRRKPNPLFVGLKKESVTQPYHSCHTTDFYTFRRVRIGLSLSLSLSLSHKS